MTVVRNDFPSSFFGEDADNTREVCEALNLARDLITFSDEKDWKTQDPSAQHQEDHHRHAATNMK